MIVGHVRSTCLAGLRRKFHERRQMRVTLRLEARFAVCGSCCKVELRKVCVAAVRVRRVELRLDSERYERKRSLCDLFGEVELRVVSAAAAVSWELRFLGRHQGRQRVNAGCCVGPTDETGNRTASRSLPTLSSWERLESQPERSRATSRSLSPSPRGDVRWAFEPFVAPGRRRRPSDRHPRPSEQQRPGRSPEGDPPPGPFGA